MIGTPINDNKYGCYYQMTCEICGEPYELVLENSINDDMTETKYSCKKCAIIRFLWTKCKNNAIYNSDEKL